VDRDPHQRALDHRVRGEGHTEGSRVEVGKAGPEGDERGGRFLGLQRGQSFHRFDDIEPLGRLDQELSRQRGPVQRIG
jgi:hypothetical protein